MTLHKITQPGQHDRDQHHAGGGEQRCGNQRGDQQTGQEAQTKLQRILQRGGTAGRLRERLQRLATTIG